MVRFAFVSAFFVTCVSCAGQSHSTTPVEAADPANGHADSPHGNHDPRHGGMVFMKGDLHFEVVLAPGGGHRIYFSDAVRAELPAATASDVTVSLSNGEAATETLRAEIDDSGESWVVNGSPLKGKDITARVSFVIGEEPYWIDIPYMPTAEGERGQP
jgi:hypothetical protein